MKTTSNSTYPRFDFDPLYWTGTLTKPFFYNTHVTGYDAVLEHIRLGVDGGLSLDVGYVWDFGSGPAVDTPDMVIASLVHDAGCDLTAAGALPWEARKKFDREFRRVLALNGTPAFRRWWCWCAVRLNSLLSRRPQ